jgi:hypothetical protein
VIDKHVRLALHTFLVQPVRNKEDLWTHACALSEILIPLGCRISLWEHPILLDVGLDIFHNNRNIRLIPTKKGYRVLGLETDMPQKSLMEIICVIQK